VADDKNIIGKEMKRIFDGSSEEEAGKDSMNSRKHGIIDMQR